MAQFVPAIVAVVGVAATAASTGVAISQANAAKKEADRVAKAEQDQARSEELDRLRKLRRVQAAVRVGAAAGGLDVNSGSVAAQLADNEKQARIEQFGSNFATNLRAAQLRSRGRNRRTAAIAGGVADLTQAGADFYDFSQRFDRARRDRQQPRA